MHDVIVVGSGATGGWVAKEMSERGFTVLVLEAGRVPATQSESNRSVEDELATEEYHVQRHCRAFNSQTQPYFVNDQEQPYITPPAALFAWIRTNVPGGRTTLWGGQVYRLSDFDFQAASRDGHGSDWPLCYRDLAPHYDHVERFLGLSGTVERLPQLPDGIFQYAPPMESVFEKQLRASCTQAGLSLIAARVAERRAWDDRSPCPHCGRIDQGCHRYINSVESTLPAALSTGLAELRTNMLVERIVVSASGKVRGVLVVDKRTRERSILDCRLLFLCASTLESTRIMLNSRSSCYPNGIGNSSGVLGHYLTVHIYGVNVAGQMRVSQAQVAPALEGTHLLYIPRWQNLVQQTHSHFPRGYSYLVAVTPLHQAVQHQPGCFNPQSISYSRKEANGRAIVSMHAFGETIPCYNNRVEIDPGGRMDVWNVPTLAIHYNYSEADYRMGSDMAATASTLLRRAGAFIMKTQEQVTEPGLCIHESGTCRMGTDPALSVLNAYNQCHDISQLFVVDGSAFPSLPAQNPTLTMMALSVRACDYAQQQIQAGMLATQWEEV